MNVYPGHRVDKKYNYIVFLLLILFCQLPIHVLYVCHVQPTTFILHATLLDLLDMYDLSWVHAMYYAYLSL